MKSAYRIWVLIWLVAWTVTGNAQPQPGQEIVVIQGKRYIIHQVRTAETIYSISRQYQLEREELLRHNPEAAEGLKIGDALKIPYREGRELQVLPISTKGDPVTFEYYIITSRTETPYFIAKSFGITVEEIYAYNPEVTRFRKGTELRIPRWDHPGITTPAEVETMPVEEELNPKGPITHEVLPGETLYGLAARYGITIAELRRHNPQLENRNPAAGETLLIPGHPQLPSLTTGTVADDDSLLHVIPASTEYSDTIDSGARSPKECHPAEKDFTQNKTYHVALFLPLFINENSQLNPIEEIAVQHEDFDLPEMFTELKQDTIIEMDIPRKSSYTFYRESKNFMEFYEGVLLAVDSMQRTGMQIRLHVYDSQHNPDSIRKFIYDPSFLETDLIIGPVYTQEQNEIAAIAAKNRIPLISPLTSQSQEIENNPWYFQINPTRDILIDKTADLITEAYSNSNLIVIETARSGAFEESKVINRVREQIKSSEEVNQSESLQIHTYKYNRGLSGFSELLSHEKENVIFIASLDEGDLSVILSNINNLTGKFSFTLIGFNRYEQFNSINEELFHNVKLQYVTPYQADYHHPGTIRFLDQFRKNFYAEPGNFGMQGYDVTIYFLHALRNFGHNFARCLHFQQVQLIQGNYQFKKVSPVGGYMNQGVSVISYEPDYDVVRKQITEPDIASPWESN